MPYLPHMCEDALKERWVKLRSRGHLQTKAESATSFDQEARAKMEEMSEERENGDGKSKRDSTAR